MANWDALKNLGFNVSEEKTPQKNFGGQKKSSSNNFGGNKNSQKTQPAKSVFSSTKATAPYNFVSLPEKVLPSPAEENHSQILSDDDKIARKSFREYIEGTERLSGEISIAIESLTPLFIGGNGAKSFAPIDEKFPIIPGSSLRGMFKNIFKIVTCGAFRGQTSSQKKGEDFNDEHIYFRCIMGIGKLSWTKDLNKVYNDRMTSMKDGKPVKNARPGFLIQIVDGKYFIAPSIYRTDRKDDRILIRDYEQTFREKIEIRNDSRIAWHGREAYIITGSQKNLYDQKSYDRLSDDAKKKAGKQFIRFTKIDYVDWSREHWLELSDDVRNSYEHDRNRKGVDLFDSKCDGILKRDEVEKLTNKNLPDVKTLVPCHFLEEGGKVTAFGHGQCFRIPYKNSVGDLVPKNLRSDIIDFADAVFGRESFWASRVFFEDAKPVEKISTLPTATAHPLMQPNPTSYQLYLNQSSDEKLNHWDSRNAELRGYKLYWHNVTEDWQANASELELDRGKSEDKRLTKDLTPLKSHSKFKSKIRFQNLSKIELGALMMLFDLNGAKNSAYKIGMGKPLGFGSIKVEPKLFIESENAYTEIFDSSGWKNPYREEDPKIYLDAFKNYVRACGMEKIWLDVMNELTLMLNFENTKKTNWREKVKSMSGDTKNVDNRFKQRASLPTIFEVVK